MRTQLCDELGDEHAYLEAGKLERPSRDTVPGRLIRRHCSSPKLYNKIRRKFRMTLVGDVSHPSILHRPTVAFPSSCLLYMQLSHLQFRPLPRSLILLKCKTHLLVPPRRFNNLQRKSPHYIIQNGNGQILQTTRVKIPRPIRGRAGKAQRKRRRIGHAFIAKRHILPVTIVCNSYIMSSIG